MCTTVPSIYISAIIYYNFKDVALILNEWGQFKKYLPVFCYMDSQDDRHSGNVVSVSMAIPV